MMGKRQKRESKLFYAGVNLEQRVPQEHPLRQIAQAVDFAFIRERVAGLYGRKGNPSVDPTLILKLCFLCFYENVRSERELIRELPLRLDWLWFCELDLDSDIPDHSVLSKARSRWGEAVFEEFFSQVLRQCGQAGLLEGRTLHADSTLLKAHAALEGRVSRKLWEQLEQARIGTPETPAAQAPDAGTPAVPPPSGKPEKLNTRLVSPVDPDAATSTRKAGGTTLGYRDHRLVDDRHGVIVATVATAADVDDGSMLVPLLERQHRYTRSLPAEVTGDSMYGTRCNYEALEQAGIKPYLKKRRGKDSPKISWLKCLPPQCSVGRALHLLGRRRSCAEGGFAEAHVRMNHRRCRWRRRNRVQMQCYLVASVQNIKKLVRWMRRRSGSIAQAVSMAQMRPIGQEPLHRSVIRRAGCRTNACHRRPCWRMSMKRN